MLRLTDSSRGWEKNESSSLEFAGRKGTLIFNFQQGGDVFSKGPQPPFIGSLFHFLCPCSVKSKRSGPFCHTPCCGIGTRFPEDWRGSYRGAGEEVLRDISPRPFASSIKEWRLQYRKETLGSTEFPQSPIPRTCLSPPDGMILSMPSNDTR